MCAPTAFSKSQGDAESPVWSDLREVSQRSREHLPCVLVWPGGHQKYFKLLTAWYNQMHSFKERKSAEEEICTAKIMLHKIILFFSPTVHSAAFTKCNIKARRFYLYQWLFSYVKYQQRLHTGFWEDAAPIDKVWIPIEKHCHSTSTNILSVSEQKWGLDNFLTSFSIYLILGAVLTFHIVHIYLVNTVFQTQERSKTSEGLHF